MDRSVKETIMKLVKRLAEEEGKIDLYLKKQIETAIRAYNMMNLKMKSSREQKDCYILLEEARKKLQNLKTVNHELSPAMISDREINMMQQYLLELENTMAKTRTEKYAEVFVRAITYAKYLERLNALHDKEPGHLSTLFVKLFVHAPYTKISESLEEISAKIYHVRFDLDRCDFDNKKIHLQEIKEKMVKIMDAIGTLERRSAQILYEIEEKIVEDPDLALDKLSDEINNHWTSLPDLPQSKSALKIIKEKMSHLEQRFDKIPARNDAARQKKKHLKEKIVFISENLSQMDKDVGILLRAESQISEILESNEDPVNKTNDSESLLKNVRRVNSINKAVKRNTNQIANRISLCITVEKMNYLRQKLAVIEEYKNYGRQFAFPKGMKIYDVRKKEIESLSDNFDCLDKDNQMFKARLDVIYARIQEAIRELEKKANENDKTISKLIELNRIQQEISDGLGQPKSLSVFNDIRDRIQNVDDFSFRVIGKKRKILQQLHHLEMEVYKKYFPEIAPEIQENLRNYEVLTQYLSSLNRDKNSLTSQEITTKRAAIEELIKTKVKAPHCEVLQILFRTFFNQMQRLLQKRDELDSLMTEINNINNDFTELSKFKPSSTEKIKNMNALEKRVGLLKFNASRSDLLTILFQFKDQIKTERAIIKIHDSVSIFVEQLSTSIKSLSSSDLSNTAVVAAVTEVLILKESVEDLPEGNAQLDNQKKIILQQLYSLLYGVDQHLAKFAFKQRNLKPFIDEENYCSTFEFADVSNKGSVEFVHKIYSYAKTLESKIECFLGEKNSIDFYIIHENLVRFSEELFQVTSNDKDVVSEVLKVTSYLKQLKSQLCSNTFCSD
ncbi:uncharacterized protein LOC135137270 isoform X2 [Zophobas morio]|uniref:uncharacterized protein LOC135137270 isoform X2 n=1 Tax=Zophobas morio TaxID=2755281 RepID=UPI003082C694